MHASDDGHGCVCYHKRRYRAQGTRNVQQISCETGKFIVIEFLLRFMEGMVLFPSLNDGLIRKV